MKSVKHFSASLDVEENIVSVPNPDCNEEHQDEYYEEHDTYSAKEEYDSDDSIQIQRGDNENEKQAVEFDSDENK